MLKSKTWSLIFSTAALLLSVLSFFLLRQREAGTTVEVIQNGVLLREIDLDRVAREESFRVEWEGGYNLVTVRPGAICVSEADCPDQICVHQGWLTDAPAPIVCLPHRLMIRRKGADAADAAAQ